MTLRSPWRVAVLAGLALVLIAGVAAVTTYYWVQIPFVKFTLPAGECKWGPPLAGVYLSGRLRLVDRCQTVSGTVHCLKAEPDGHIHLPLPVAPQFPGLLEAADPIQTCANQPRAQHR